MLTNRSTLLAASLFALAGSVSPTLGQHTQHAFQARSPHRSVENVAPALRAQPTLQPPSSRMSRIPRDTSVTRVATRSSATPRTPRIAQATSRASDQPANSVATPSRRISIVGENTAAAHATRGARQVTRSSEQMQAQREQLREKGRKSSVAQRITDTSVQTRVVTQSSTSLAQDRQVTNSSSRVREGRTINRSSNEIRDAQTITRSSRVIRESNANSKTPHMRFEPKRQATREAKAGGRISTAAPSAKATKVVAAKASTKRTLG